MAKFAEMAARYEKLTAQEKEEIDKQNAAVNDLSGNFSLVGNRIVLQENKD